MPISWHLQAYVYQTLSKHNMSDGLLLAEGKFREAQRILIKIKSACVDEFIYIYMCEYVFVYLKMYDVLFPRVRVIYVVITYLNQEYII